MKARASHLPPRAPTQISTTPRRLKRSCRRRYRSARRAGLRSRVPQRRRSSSDGAAAVSGRRAPGFARRPALVCHGGGSTIRMVWSTRGSYGPVGILCVSSSQRRQCSANYHGHRVRTQRRLRGRQHGSLPLRSGCLRLMSTPRDTDLTRRTSIRRRSNRAHLGRTHHAVRKPRRSRAKARSTRRAAESCCSSPALQRPSQSPS